MAALCTLGNKEGLIDKVCVAKDEQVGVYGFVFHRDGEWRSEIIDDKLYLTKPDYDESWIERNLMEDRQRINSEEDYRKIYQVGLPIEFVKRILMAVEQLWCIVLCPMRRSKRDMAAVAGKSVCEGPWSRSRY
jgi:hypothetical protein